MTHDEASSLLALYILGSLDETDELQRHVDSCPICQAELASFQQTTAVLGGAAPRVAPPSQVFERIAASVELRAAASREQLSAPPAKNLPVADSVMPFLLRLSFRMNLRPLTAVALVLVLAIGIGAGILIERFGLSSPPSELALDRQALSLLTSTETTNVRLEPVQSIGGDAHGHWFFRNGVKSVVLVVESMPPVSDGMSYWGWLQRKDGTWVSAGRFSLDRTGYGRLVITGVDGANLALAEVTAQVQQTTKPGTGVLLRSP